MTTQGSTIADGSAGERRENGRRSKIVMVFGASHRATAATGPVSSLKYLIAALEDEFDIEVLAKPRLGLPYTADIPDGYFEAARYLRKTPYDLLYLNSFFDREYTVPLLTFRKLGLIPRKPTLVAPRGELLENALRLKGVAKQAYIAMVRASGLFDDVWMQATSKLEFEALSASFSWAKGPLLAEEICGPMEAQARAPHDSGPLRIVFLSRISEKKNLHYGIEALGLAKCPIVFDIYGPREEPEYWSVCERAIEALPVHVTVTYKGAVANTDVPVALAEADLFFLPTLSENFGYAIYEAMACGVPVLISDQTPWRDLQKWPAGWDLPLDDKAAFTRIVEEMAALDPAGRERLRDGARRCAASYLAQQDAVANNRRMFRKLLDNAA